MLRTGQALELAIHPRTLYELRDAGKIVSITRGRYRLAGLPPLGNPDLVAVASAAPKGVICLISALAFHGITTQVPHQVDLALANKGNRPRLKYPPVRVFWFSGPAFSEGIQTHVLDGVNVRVYSPAKTVADCFKYRNKIGLDIALEALRLCRRQRQATVDELMGCARTCRVANVIRPYLEAML
jgi:predicted transcriptional regulator of viral defense system